MSANARSHQTTATKTYGEILSRLAVLNAAAVELIQRDSRSPKMNDELLRALQLFKEGRLGSVHPLVPEGRAEWEGLRTGLKERISKEGAEVVYRSFLNEVPLRIQSGLCYKGIRTFRELLQSDRFSLIQGGGRLGHKGIDVLEAILARYGLSFTLGQEQIAELFS
jgi:hypothetical protein